MIFIQKKFNPKLTFKRVVLLGFAVVAPRANLDMANEVVQSTRHSTGRIVEIAVVLSGKRELKLGFE